MISSYNRKETLKVILNARLKFCARQVPICGITMRLITSKTRRYWILYSRSAAVIVTTLLTANVTLLTFIRLKVPEPRIEIVKWRASQPSKAHGNNGICQI